MHVRKNVVERREMANSIVLKSSIKLENKIFHFLFLTTSIKTYSHRVRLCLELKPFIMHLCLIPDIFDKIAILNVTVVNNYI